jgi:hypothetical protein
MAKSGSPGPVSGREPISGVNPAFISCGDDQAGWSMRPWESVPARAGGDEADSQGRMDHPAWSSLAANGCGEFKPTSLDVIQATFSRPRSRIDRRVESGDRSKDARCARARSRWGCASGHSRRSLAITFGRPAFLGSTGGTLRQRPPSRRLCRPAFLASTQGAVSRSPDLRHVRSGSGRSSQGVPQAPGVAGPAHAPIRVGCRDPALPIRDPWFDPGNLGAGPAGPVTLEQGAQATRTTFPETTRARTRQWSRNQPMRGRARVGGQWQGNEGGLLGDAGSFLKDVGDLAELGART